MTVKELKSILDRYDDNTEIQINIADSYKITSTSNITLDDDYDIDDALVLEINLPAWCYIGERL